MNTDSGAVGRMRRRMYQTVRVTDDWTITRYWEPTPSWFLHQWQLHVEGWRDLVNLFRGRMTDRVASLRLWEHT